MSSSKRSSADSSHVRAAEGAERDRASLEQELAGLKKALEQRDAALLAADRLRALGALTATMLHDLSNHVTVQRSCAELLARTAALDPEQAEVSADLRTSLAHSAQVLTRLATLAHGEPLATGHARFDETVRAVMRWLSHVLPPRARLEAQLKASDAQAAIDVAVLAQVVLDLALQARDQLPEAGGSIVLATELVPPSRDTLSLTVSAGGDGRAGSWRPRSPGEAPALAVTALLLDGVGGTLEVRGEPGVLVFRARLPVAP